MRRKLAFFLAIVMMFCLFITACDDDTKNKKEPLEELKEDLQGGLMIPMETIEMVQVPRFIGKMYYAEVENVEEYDYNFNLQIKWEDANDPSCKKGEVFKQSVAAGDKVAKGATITLYVNGVVLDPVALDLDPAEITGTHKNTVRLWLQDAGFAVYESYQNSGSVPAHHVISIDIEVGKAYPYGTRVTMLISTGP